MLHRLEIISFQCKYNEKYFSLLLLLSENGLSLESKLKRIRNCLYKSNKV